MVAIENKTGIQCISKIEWQQILFSNSPKRSELVRPNEQWDYHKFRLNIHRTRPFEFIASVMVPYLNYAGFDPIISYSDYDDSLSFVGIENADIELIWLDFSRYSGQMSTNAMFEWLVARIGVLRSQTNAPIVLLDWDSFDEEAKEFNKKIRIGLEALNEIHIVSQKEIMNDLGAAYRDMRAARITGMDLSDAACIQLGKLLGSVWIPSLLGLRIKAIVLDLDNTLYEGVLGEDGAEGVVLTDGHMILHKKLREFREKGIFLALCSKNELDDVERLFNKRDDFPLELSDFSVKAISWDEKSQGIADVASKLRIGLDSILFIDDNPGELMEVSGVLKELNYLHASKVAEETTSALEYYPGLFRPKVELEDGIRIKDLEKAEIRDKLLVEKVSKVDYFRSLEVKLVFQVDPSEHMSRLSELSQKTNQFNTGLKRFREIDVANYINDSSRNVVSIHLRDCLSDSGIIGAVFFHRNGDILLVDEIAISCRALGRHIESLAIWEAVSKISQIGKISKVEFFFAQGPRNEPARNWFKKNLTECEEINKWIVSSDTAAEKKLLEDIPVDIEWS